MIPVLTWTIPELIFVEVAFSEYKLEVLTWVVAARVLHTISFKTNTLLTLKDPAVSAPVIMALPETFKLSPIPTPPATTNAPLLVLSLCFVLVIFVIPEIFVFDNREFPAAETPPYKTRDPLV